MIDPVSAVGTATGLGAGLGMVIRLAGFVGGFLERKEQERTRRDAILTGNIKAFQTAVDSAQVDLREVDNESTLEWKIGPWTLFRRVWKQKGKKPVFTLRQHAISYTIYNWVSVYSACAAAFVYWPNHIIYTIPPSNLERKFSILWGALEWNLPAGTPVQLSTGGIGWAMLSVMVGVITMLVVGVAGRK